MDDIFKQIEEKYSINFSENIAMKEYIELAVSEKIVSEYEVLEYLGYSYLDEEDFYNEIKECVRMYLNKRYTESEIRDDIQHIENLLDNNIDIDDYELVNVMKPGLVDGTITMKDFLLWHLLGLYYQSVYKKGGKYMDTINNNELAKEIKDKYLIVID